MLRMFKFYLYALYRYLGVIDWHLLWMHHGSWVDIDLIALNCILLIAYAFASHNPVVMCGKTKFSSDSVFKNRTIQKFNICSDGFPIETACNLPFK